MFLSRPRPELPKGGYARAINKSEKGGARLNSSSTSDSPFARLSSSVSATGGWVD